VDVAGIEPALPGLGDIPPASGQTILRPVEKWIELEC